MYDTIPSLVPFQGIALFAGLLGIMQSIIWSLLIIVFLFMKFYSWSPKPGQEWHVSVAFFTLYFNSIYEIDVKSGRNIYSTPATRLVYVSYYVGILLLLINLVWLFLSYYLTKRVIDARKMYCGLKIGIQKYIQLRKAYLIWSIFTFIMSLLDVFFTGWIIHTMTSADGEILDNIILNGLHSKTIISSVKNNEYNINEDAEIFVNEIETRLKSNTLNQDKVPTETNHSTIITTYSDKTIGPYRNLVLDDVFHRSKSNLVEKDEIKITTHTSDLKEVIPKRLTMYYIKYPNHTLHFATTPVVKQVRFASKDKSSESKEFLSLNSRNKDKINKIVENEMLDDTLDYGFLSKMSNSRENISNRNSFRSDLGMFDKKRSKETFRPRNFVDRHFSKRSFKAPIKRDVILNNYLSLRKKQLNKRLTSDQGGFNISTNLEDILAGIIITKYSKPSKNFQYFHQIFPDEIKPKIEISTENTEELGTDKIIKNYSEEDNNFSKTFPHWENYFDPRININPK